MFSQMRNIFDTAKFDDCLKFQLLSVMNDNFWKEFSKLLCAYPGKIKSIIIQN